MHLFLVYSIFNINKNIIAYGDMNMIDTILKNIINNDIKLNSFLFMFLIAYNGTHILVRPIATNQKLESENKE